MKTMQRFGDLDWFDFIDLVKEKLEKKVGFRTCLEFLDELYLRKIDSVSEGATFKIKAQATMIKNYLQDFSLTVAEEKEVEYVYQRLMIN